MSNWKHINRQIDLLEAAGLEPGVDWRIMRRFGKPWVELRTTRAANTLVRELAKIDCVAAAARHHGNGTGRK